MRRGPVITAFARVCMVAGLVVTSIIVDYRDMIAFFTPPFGVVAKQDPEAPAEAEPSSSAPALEFSQVSDKRHYSVTIRCDTIAMERGYELAQQLQARGIEVRHVYECSIPTTVVAYSEAKEQTMAESIVSMLGIGQVVGGSEDYNYKGDILVLVGADAVA